MEAHVSMAKWQQSVWVLSAVKGTKFDIKHKAAQSQCQCQHPASLKTSTQREKKINHLCPLDRVS